MKHLHNFERYGELRFVIMEENGGSALLVFLKNILNLSLKRKIEPRSKNIAPQKNFLFLYDIYYMLLLYQLSMTL